MKRTVLFWLVTGLVGFAIFPWHMIGDGTPASGLRMAFSAGLWWLAPIGLALIAALVAQLRIQARTRPLARL